MTRHGCGTAANRGSGLAGAAQGGAESPPVSCPALALWSLSWVLQTVSCALLPRPLTMEENGIVQGWGSGSGEYLRLGTVGLASI